MILRKVPFLSHFHMIDKDFPFIRPEETADALHKHRLAGAVVANDAVNLPLFKGMVDVSVNKIKLTKRIMYGRNSFALLRAKLLLNKRFN